MLQERLNECQLLMAEVSQNKQKDNEHQAAVKKNNTFFDTCNNFLVPIIKGYPQCKKYDHIRFSKEINEDLHKYIEYSKRTFDQKIVMNPTNYQEGVKRLSKRIQDEWKVQTENFLADIKEELSILKLVSNEKHEIQKILICLNNFSNWPVDENITIQYERASQQAKDILSRMEFDDEISAFLKKVKNKEATLLDLSDSIIAWIRKEGLSRNIMLSIKN